MDDTKRVLFVNSEIFPYLPQSDISIAGRYLPQAVQESGSEIRSFMPRYGCINERRNQLHEVIRLSGMNIVVGEQDYSLVIKVASVSAARMQVYFIDNEECFQRKQIYADQNGKFFADNAERALFFARGVLETVKKLRWNPDVVHCQGWMTHFLPILLKKVYSSDPVFADAKVVLSLYNDIAPDEKFNPDTVSFLATDGIRKSDLSVLSTPCGTALAKLAIRWCDGIIEGAPDLDPEIAAAVAARKVPVLGYRPISAEDLSYTADYNAFYDKIIAQNVKSR